MSRRLTAAALLVPLAATGVLTGGTAGAAPSGADLVARGYAVGGLTATESSHPLTFVFSVTNRGPRAVGSSADLQVVSIGNADLVDQVCVLPSGYGINSDGAYCEPGALAVGETHRMIVIVQPRDSGTPVTVRVCVSNEEGLADPRPGNDCRTASVSV